MKDVLKQIAPHLRTLGFRGSGQNYRKADGDFVFVVNFQGSQAGDVFFVNLGAQPTFIPNEGYAELNKLKEYECIFRTRVGREWPWDMSNGAVASFVQDLTSTQAAFFGHVQTLPHAIASDDPRKLLSEFASGQTHARAALHLARAARALGHPEKSRELAHLGLELASEQASILRAQLNNVLSF